MKKNHGGKKIDKWALQFSIFSIVLSIFNFSVGMIGMLTSLANTKILEILLAAVIFLISTSSAFIINHISREENADLRKCLISFFVISIAVFALAILNLYFVMTHILNYL